ncbi:MAG: YceI family protein [Gammaproteobacteria bacterium]
MIRSLTASLALGALFTVGPATSALAADYEVDPAHSFIQFRIKHLGYSWLIGRFNNMNGSFNYDAGNPANSAIQVVIDTRSIDTNHAKRDKHLRSDDFLKTDVHGNATFKSTAFEGDANGGKLTGELSLLGVTKPVTLEISKIGEGDDPWGGYRAGFEGTTNLTRADFGDEYNLGPASEKMELELYVEGIRK